jgi:hypothetical protein
MNTQSDTHAVERVRAIIGRSMLDTVSADLIWQASTAADLRRIITQRLPAVPLKTALLAACGPVEDLDH